MHNFKEMVKHNIKIFWYEHLDEEKNINVKLYFHVSLRCPKNFCEVL